MKNNFLLIGRGVVGSAVHQGLGKNNFVAILDPALGFELGKDLTYDYFDGIIICLPTPQGPTGECDDFMVEQYMREIRMEAPTVPILIKSTISIELVEFLEEDENVTYNPEFLTEADSANEFKNQRFAIFGGMTGRFWYYVFVNSDIMIQKVRFTSMKNAAFAKYAINTFLATKVVFFNELQALHKKFKGGEFDSLTDLISLDDRIGESHMMVPGPDRKYGFGGMCFPKDTRAFATSAKRAGSRLKLLENVIEINKEIR